MERIFGGSPIAVVLRLVVISVIVGVVLRAFKISPVDVFRHLQDLARYLSSFGYEALDLVLESFLLGAAVVIPVWAIYRLIQLAGTGKRGRG